MNTVSVFSLWHILFGLILIEQLKMVQLQDLNEALEELKKKKQLDSVAGETPED